MRKQAFILILPFVIFITETVSYVPLMQDSCMLVAKKESSCCVMPAETAGSECSSEEGDTEAPADCTENPDCTTCPVCYTFICPATYELPAQHFVLKNNYASLMASYSSSYTCNVWKPPNASLTS